ncbi:hypothetical protein [Aneurinibacillus tyrosinisolvens]|nr:hypothetical protein [Aneurinibacillus tyrosinisolvens]
MKNMRDQQRDVLADKEATEKFVNEVLPKIILRLRKEGKLPVSYTDESAQ